VSGVRQVLSKFVQFCPVSALEPGLNPMQTINLSGIRQVLSGVVTLAVWWAAGSIPAASTIPPVGSPTGAGLPVMLSAPAAFRLARVRLSDGGRTISPIFMPVESIEAVLLPGAIRAVVGSEVDQEPEGRAASVAIHACG